MSSPKLNVYSARNTSASGLDGKPSDYDGLVLLRQNWACIVRTRRDDQSTSASTLTFAAWAPKGTLMSRKRSSCHGSRTLQSRSFNSLWRPTSRMCQVLTWSASTSLMPSKPSQFASTKRVMWPSKSTASGTPTESSRSALPPIPSCVRRISAVLSREGQSMLQPAELRVQTVDDPAWVSQGPPLRRRVLSVTLLLSWRKGKYGQCMRWMGTTITVRPHLGFCAVWIRNPSAQSNRTPGPHGKTFTQRRTRGRQRSFTCRWSRRLGRWSLPVARDS